MNGGDVDSQAARAGAGVSFAALLINLEGAPREMPTRGTDRQRVRCHRLILPRGQGFLSGPELRAGNQNTPSS